jgi:DNA-binding NarL/FixJ family response regulator
MIIYKKSMLKKLNLLIAEKDSLTRAGLSAHKPLMTYFESVREATSVQQALNLVREYRPDVVINGIGFQDHDYLGSINGEEHGFIAVKQLREAAPNAHILVYSTKNEIGAITSCLWFGAKGYLIKSDPLEDVVNAIASLDTSDPLFSRTSAKTMSAAANYLLKKLAGVGEQLTNREEEVIRLAALGLQNKEIASIFEVGVRTIETFRERINAKLGTHNVAGLTKWAVQTGRVSPTYELTPS